MGLCCSTAELLNLSVSVQMEPVLMYFRSLRIQPAQLMAMVFFHPRLLSYSVAEDLEPVVSKLSDAGIDREQLPLLLEKVPQVLEDGPVCLRELQEVLEGKVGIGWWEAGTVLLEVLPKARRPREVAQVVEFLASLQVDEDDVRMLGRFHPWVLAMSMEDLKVRLAAHRALIYIYPSSFPLPARNPVIPSPLPCLCEFAPFLPAMGTGTLSALQQAHFHPPLPHSLYCAPARPPSFLLTTLHSPLTLPAW
mmetsp:Transcript_18134/g.50752  ORF Transcript_18134/g.50752 Transcript_18134/m.50752 type:complete len:250 (+) Transcript_18134:1163-1912(+)